MDSGAPVPRAMGETLRDSRAEMVQASMSRVATVEAIDTVGWWCDAGW